MIILQKFLKYNIFLEVGDRKMNGSRDISVTDLVYGTASYFITVYMVSAMIVKFTKYVFNLCNGLFNDTSPSIYEIAFISAFSAILVILYLTKKDYLSNPFILTGINISLFISIFNLLPFYIEHLDKNIPAKNMNLILNILTHARSSIEPKFVIFGYVFSVGLWILDITKKG